MSLGFWGLRRFEDEVPGGFHVAFWAAAVMAFRALGRFME